MCTLSEHRQAPGGPSPAHSPLPGCRASWLFGACMNSRADDLGVDLLAVLDEVAPEIIMQYHVNNEIVPSRGLVVTFSNSVRAGKKKV